MTPTTSSSSITLLTASAPSAKTASTNSTEATPDATVSGFELLLGAMQQLQQKLPTQKIDGNTEQKSPGNGVDENGNALPQTGVVLPSLAFSLPQTTATNSKADSKESKNSDDDTSANNLPLALNLSAVAAAGVVIQPHRSEATATTTDTGDAAASADMSIALDTQLGGGKAGKAASNASTETTKNSVNTEDNTVSTIGNAAATTLKASTGLQQSATESDFDALVKHFDVSATAQNTQIPAAANISDSASAQQAARSDINAANNSASVSIPVGSNGWSDAVADKVMWFSANKISSAEIHLNPPDLGPLQVRVSTQHDQASVVFTSQHAAVRDALDQALPRLRDMMGSQGMHLLDVSVGGQGAQQQQQQQQFARNNSGDRNASFAGFFTDDSTESVAASVTTVNAGRFQRAGVDAYA